MHPKKTNTRPVPIENAEPGRISRDIIMNNGEDRNPEYAIITSLYTKHSRGLLRFIISKIRNTEEAFDILQNVFLTLLEKQGKELAITDNFKSYLFRCASNKIADYYRKVASSKMSVYEPEEIAGPDYISDLEAMMISGEILDTVHDAMTVLNEEEGEIIYRKYFINEKKSKICSETKLSRYKLDKMLSNIILKVKENLPSYFSM